MASGAPVRVLLLHGLWLRAFTLARLAARLRVAGFDPELLDFGSVHDEPEQTIAALCERLGSDGPPVGLVGHSLGGLLALQALRSGPALPVTRVVCLGSPLRGSRAARTLARYRGGRWLLGRSRGLLRDGLPAWDGPAEVGVVAGCVPIGLGFALAPMQRPHDGTVCAEETRLPGLADHVQVRATHTGLLLSREAADQTVHFLRHGCFRRPDPG